MGDIGLLSRLPKIRGVYRQDVSLSKINWFNVGGNAEILFKPEDEEDLAFFLKNRPSDIKITVLGVGSNLLVRDGGISGVVIRLGRNFANLQAEGNKIIVGAGCLDVNLAKFAQENSIANLEFFVGIPGTVGGALAMNAGAYGNDVSKVLLEARGIDFKGNILELKNKDFGFYYRGHTINYPLIFTLAKFVGIEGNKEEIIEAMNEISNKREETQPIRSRTSGSTFKNPEGFKAWELIDKAGCRGLKVGGAQVSEKHCNFFINTGNATADDIEKLGEEVINRVKKQTDITLEWEIKIIGNKL